MKKQITLNSFPEDTDNNDVQPNQPEQNSVFPSPMGDESPTVGVGPAGLQYAEQNRARKLAAEEALKEEAKSNAILRGLDAEVINCLSADPEQQKRLIMEYLINAGVYDSEDVFSQKNYALSFLLPVFQRILELRVKENVAMLVNYHFGKRVGIDLVTIHRIFSEVFPTASIATLSGNVSLESLTGKFVAVNKDNKAAYHIVIKADVDSDTKPSKLESKYKLINMRMPGKESLTYFLLSACHLTGRAITDEDQTKIALMSFEDLAKKQALLDIASGLNGLRGAAPKSQSTVNKSGGLSSLVLDDRVSEWAENLVDDIKAFQRGEITWEMIDKGAIFTGAPGTGKTCLAQAIAKDSGLNFVQASASADWMGGGHLGECVRAMKATFAEAKKHAPCILFIDEIDGMGSRANQTKSSSDWVTWMVNTLLTEVNDMSESKVILLGATNYIENVDPAIKRAGRLDKVLFIPKPSEKALKAIYQLKLGEFAKNGSHLYESDFDSCAINSAGMTGADVERILKTALRKSRKRGQLLMIQDVIETIYEIPEKALNYSNTSLSLDTTATHEVGHAIVAHAVGSFNIDFLSINPYMNSAGQARVSPKAFNNTARGMRDGICVLLAGIAAEELKFGLDGLSTGAGCSEDSDIQRAGKIAQDYFNKYGFGGVEKTVASTESNEEHVQQLIAVEYERAKSILQQNDDLFETLQKALMDKKYLLKEQIEQILSPSA